MTDHAKTLENEARTALAQVTKDNPLAGSITAIVRAVVAEVTETETARRQPMQALAKELAQELQGYNDTRNIAQLRRQHNDELFRVAEMALVVLDSCGCKLVGSVISINNQYHVTDPMSVNAYKALKQIAKQLGIDEDALRLRVDGAFRAQEEAARAQLTEEEFDQRHTVEDLKILDAEEMGTGGRKGIFK